MSWVNPRTWAAADLVTASKMNEIRDSLRSSGGTYSTNVPSSPNDQDQFTYPADPTNGAIWEFKYASASASTYKWQFSGGAPMYSTVATDESSASTTYVDLATVGPSVTVPRAGDYMVRWGATCYNNANNANPYTAVKRGAAATSDSDAATFAYSSTSVTTPGVSIAREVLMTGLSASDVLKLQYRVAAATGHWVNRFISVTPVRII